MATNPIPTALPHANSRFPKDAADFSINGCKELENEGIDAVRQILPMIHGMASLLGQPAVLDEVNPSAIAATGDGIAYLAATAMFHAQKG